MCDWGAMTFADPYLTVPEVARLLRPGGLFAWTGATPWDWAAYDAETDEQAERLQADYFGMHRWDEPEGAVEFMLPYGEWIRLFRANGLVVEDLIEVRPPEGAPVDISLRGADGVGASLADGADLEGAQGVSGSPVPPLLLASTSPQRRAILEQLGLPFDVVAPDYEEHDPPGADAVELVREHALGKARSVAAQAGERPVLAVDTAVSLGGAIFGKPADATDAERMLEALAG